MHLATLSDGALERGQEGVVAPAGRAAAPDAVLEDVLALATANRAAEVGGPRVALVIVDYQRRVAAARLTDQARFAEDFAQLLEAAETVRVGVDPDTPPRSLSRQPGRR